MDEKSYNEAAQLVRNSLLSRSESKSHKSIIKEVQKALDTDDNGVVDLTELEEYIYELGVEKIQVNQILNAIDIDRSNKISFRELKLFLFPETSEEVDREFGIVLIAAKTAVIRTVGLNAAEGTANELLKAFGKISKSNVIRGLLDCVCVKKSFLALRNLELDYPRLLPHEADLLVKSLDTNGDGVVSPNEFQEWLMVGRKNKLFTSPSTSSAQRKSPSPSKASKMNIKQEPKLLEKSEILLNTLVSRHLRKNQIKNSSKSRNRYDNLGQSLSRSSLNSTSNSQNLELALLKSPASTTTLGTGGTGGNIPGAMKKEIQQQVYTQVNRQIDRLNFGTGKIASDVYSLKSQVNTLLSAHSESRGKLNEVYSHYLDGNRKIYKAQILAERTARDVKSSLSKLTKAQTNAEKRIGVSLKDLFMQIKRLDKRVSETRRSVLKGGKSNSSSSSSNSNSSNRKQMKNTVNQNKIVPSSNDTVNTVTTTTRTGTKIRTRRTYTKVMKKVIKKEPLWKPTGSLKYWQPPAPSSSSKKKSSSTSNITEASIKSRLLFKDRLRQSVESWTSRKSQADREDRRLRALNRRHELEVEASAKGSKRHGPRWHGPCALSIRHINGQKHLYHPNPHTIHGVSSDSHGNGEGERKKKKPMNQYQKRLARDAHAAAQGRKMMEDLKHALESANVYVSDITIQTENQYSGVLNESKDDWWAALMARKEAAERAAEVLVMTTSRSQPEVASEEN